MYSKLWIESSIDDVGERTPQKMGVERARDQATQKMTPLNVYGWEIPLVLSSTNNGFSIKL